MSSPTDPTPDDSSYVDGHAAAEMQNERVRPPEPTTEQAPAHGDPRPPLRHRIGQAIRRLLERSRTRTRPVAVALAAGSLALGACTAEPTDADADAAAAGNATSTAEPTTNAATAETAATGTSSCTDPTDDATVVDTDAHDAYDGQAYATDTVEITLDVSEDTVSIRTQENPDKVDRHPAGPLRFDFWFSSPDGSETGLVRVTAPGPADIDVEAGTDAASLEPLEGSSPRFGAPGSFLMSVDRVTLPVLEGSFRWAFVETMEGNGTADACPNQVTLDAPLDDPDAMTVFPG